jgi:hypothetical protein
VLQVAVDLLLVSQGEVGLARDETLQRLSAGLQPLGDSRQAVFVGELPGAQFRLSQA